MPRILIAVAAGVVLTVLGYGITIWIAGHYLPFSAEGKITTAFPLAPELRTRLDRVAAFDDPVGVQNVQQQLEVRLRLRALNCASAYIPAWYDSIETVKERAANPSCFARQDIDLGIWAGLMEIGLLLRQPPLRPIPVLPAAVLRADAFIHSVGFAAQAGVGLFHTRQSIQVLDIGSGEVLFSESSKPGRNVGKPSANGHVFAESEPYLLKIKEAATGRTIGEIPDVAGFELVWLDERTAVILGRSGIRFIDFSRGQFIKTEFPSEFGRAVPVPGKLDHYVLVGEWQAIEVQLVQRDTTPLVEVVRKVDGATKGFLGFSDTINQSELSIDGNTYIGPTGFGGLNFLSLQDLQSQQTDTGPFEIKRVLPTTDPAKLLFTGRLKPFGLGVDEMFVIDLAHQRLAPVNGGGTQWGRMEYVRPLQQLGIIKDSTFNLVDDLPLGTETDVSEWRGRMVEEVANRKINAMTQSAQVPYESVMSSGGARIVAPAPPAPPIFTPASPSPPMPGTQIRPLTAETQVEAVGVYESANGRHGGGVHIPGVIDIEVRKTKQPLTLMLSSYEPIIWKLHLQPGSNIRQVLLSGYHHSTVEGAGNAKVIVINAGYNYQSSGYQRLPADVVSLTGQTTGLFQGTYSGERFSVGNN